MLSTDHSTVNYRYAVLVFILFLIFQNRKSCDKWLLFCTKTNQTGTWRLRQVNVADFCSFFISTSIVLATLAVCTSDGRDVCGRLLLIGGCVLADCTFVSITTACAEVASSQWHSSVNHVRVVTPLQQAHVLEHSRLCTTTLSPRSFRLESTVYRLTLNIEHCAVYQDT